jgi:hypothetical protein
MVQEFVMVGDYDLEPVRSVYNYPLEALLHDVPNVNDVVERKLTSVERDFYQMVVPRLVASKISRLGSSLIFFTHGSKARRVVYIILVVLSPAFVLGSQKECLLWRYNIYLILTDSMGSLKALQTRRVAPRTHSLIYEIKEACWWLKILLIFSLCLG